MDKEHLDWSKSFMYALHQTYFLAEKRLEQRLSRAGGITFSQFIIMLGIRCKGQPSQNTIADFLFLTEATVSRHVTLLVAEKCITRKTNPDNRRKHILEMTPKGQKSFAEAQAIIERELGDIFSIIPNASRAEITKVFDRVITHLRETQRHTHI